MKLSTLAAVFGVPIVIGLWWRALVASGAETSDMVGFGGAALVAGLFAWLFSRRERGEETRGEALPHAEVRNTNDAFLAPVSGVDHGVSVEPLWEEPIEPATSRYRDESGWDEASEYPGADTVYRRADTVPLGTRLPEFDELADDGARRDDDWEESRRDELDGGRAPERMSDTGAFERWDDQTQELPVYEVTDADQILESETWAHVPRVESRTPHPTEDEPVMHPAAMHTHFGAPIASPAAATARLGARDTPTLGLVIEPVMEFHGAGGPVLELTRRVVESPPPRRNPTPVVAPHVAPSDKFVTRETPVAEWTADDFGESDALRAESSRSDENQIVRAIDPVPQTEEPPSRSLPAAAPVDSSNSFTPFAWEWNMATGQVTCSRRWLDLVGDSDADEQGAAEVLGRLDAPSRELLLNGLSDALSDPYSRHVIDLELAEREDARSVSVELRAGRDSSGEVIRVIADLLSADDAALASAIGEDTTALLERALGQAGIAMVEVTSGGRLMDSTSGVGTLADDWPTSQHWWSAISTRVGHTRTDGPVASTRTVDLCSPRGMRRVYEVTIAADGEHAVALARDATSTVRAAESLRESEARYALAVRAANDGLWDWNLLTDEVYFSNRWLDMLGLSEDETDGTPGVWLSRVHPEDVDGLRDALDLHLSGGSDHVEHETRVLHRDGEYRWMLTRGIALRDEAGRAYRLAGSQSDVTERKRAESKLVHDALYDPLTQLPNRALFIDLLGRAIRRHRRRPDGGFAVLFLDLDRFKLINDSLGHLAGDELLVGFSERLKECLRLGDTVARMGGDEFTILLEETVEIDEAIVVAERIQEALKRPFELAGSEVFTSASIGVAMSSRTYEGPDDILRDADTAMYRAKAMGKAQHAVFDSKMHAEARSLLQMHMELRHAVERSELELQYQPIVDLVTGRLSGFEALVRWRHPERGLVWPEEFIPVAEENGLIEPISRWVMEDACRQTQEWRNETPNAENVTISVNLSSRSFSHPGIVDVVAQVLQETGLPASALKLEVTESSIMDNHSSSDVMDALKELGVQLYLDDFGTGYSSLSYLQRFNVDALKIDKSFVQRLAGEGEPGEIVGAITSLAHNLGLKVIAEGVQTPAQLEQLRALGCEFGQGYLFSRPLDPAYAHSLIVEDPTWD